MDGAHAHLAAVNFYTLFSFMTNLDHKVIFFHVYCIYPALNRMVLNIWTEESNSFLILSFTSFFEFISTEKQLGKDS